MLSLATCPEYVRRQERLSTNGYEPFHGGWENPLYVTFEAQFHTSVLVVLGLAVVDDDVGHAAINRHKRSGGSGIDRKGGAERDDEVSFAGGREGTLKVSLNEILAKVDRRRFQEAIAMAQWRLDGVAEAGEVGIWLAALKTTLTFDLCIRTVNLD